jgi:N-acetylglutamate synthase-like GNAT family acetyltransferase
MGRLEIRRASLNDLNDLTRLMREADERPYTTSDVQRILHNLNEDRFVAWIAYADSFPCGITMLERKTLRWRNCDLHSGFWVNLYVRPSMRQTRLFVKMVMTMFQAAPALGFDLLYAATRRSQVAEANIALGMTEVGRIPLYGCILRPGRLLAKYRRLGVYLRPICYIADCIYYPVVYLRDISWQHNATIAQCDWIDESLHDVTTLRDYVSRDCVYTPLNSQQYKDRFDVAPDRGYYELLTSRCNGTLRGAIAWRMAERGPSIRAGIVMDVVPSSEDFDHFKALFRTIHQRARNNGAEIVLALPGWGSSAETYLQELGYRRMPEQYVVMMRPIKNLPADFPVNDIRKWRYTFADNDAF